jgi:hypothetical protein
MANLMRKIKITLCLLFLLSSFQLKAQESVPFSLKMFLNDYGNFMDGFLDLNNPNINYIKSSGTNYFMTIDGLRLWPDNFDLEDNYYKHRLDPEEYYNQFDKLRSYTSKNFYYGRRELGEVELVKSKSHKFFDKYRLYVTNVHYFINNNMFAAQRDSLVRISNYYDVVSWFNPNTELYEWRINRIRNTQAKSALIPQKVDISFGYVFPEINLEGIDMNSKFGFSSGLNAEWILTGKNYFNLSFLSGLNYSLFNFDITKNDFISTFSGLKDKDNEPFTLYADVKDFNQSLKFQMLSIPLQLKWNNFLKNKRQSLSLSAGMNIHFPMNVTSTNNSGEITYSGKYKFDFSSDSILLNNLNNYGFKSFGYQELSNNELKFNSVFLSAEIGAEFSWYLGKKWVASLNAGYKKSITPFYEKGNSEMIYDVVENGKYGDFEPQLNSFLALNEKSFLNTLNFGFRISCLIEKLVIPYSKPGYKNSQINNLIKGKMVTSGTSFSQKNENKTVTLHLSDVAGSSPRINWRYIGPTPRYFESGRLKDGARKSNKLTLMVPSGNNANLFLEEPYGYELIPQEIDYSSGGMYGEIKKLNAADIWKEQSNNATLNVQYNRLNKLNVFLITYRASYDDRDRIKISLISRIKQAVDELIRNDEAAVIYIVSDKPRGWIIKESSELEKYINEIDLELTATNEVSRNIAGLESFLTANNINPRRRINCDISISEEFISYARSMVEDFPRNLNIDNNYIDYNFFMYSFGKEKDPYFDSTLEFLNKVGKIIN